MDRKRILDENRNQGRWGEWYGDAQQIIQGHKIVPTGRGSDRYIEDEDKLIDYKTGDAELSEYQEECGAEEYRVWVPPFLRKFRPRR